MDRPRHSFDNYGLHLAAIAGDDEGVQRALGLGADVNALDAAGRTAVMCAVAGEHWEDIDASGASSMNIKRLDAIRLLVGRPDVSLLTLNTPVHSMNGVIPLGMAAWLNIPEAVRVLLEASTDAVAVDGMDGHGATALMYAARDGGLEVVQLLLAHGARPDFRDCNHRTSIQFALAHPQILWLCETILRRHRWRESESTDRKKLFAESEHLLELASSSLPSSDSLDPPPRSVFTSQATSRITDALVSSVVSSDLSFLHSLLFSPPPPPSSPPALYPMSSPILVNRSDSRGWSPIHYSVSVAHPSIDVLDALYCAGADVSLFTTKEHHTPLHILAKSIKPCMDPDDSLSLYQFTVHLIRDLRAPLSARDKNDETCIHVAAEHGDCMDLLMVLLDCDTTRSVREMRNSRGLTALEVAKPEFRAAFGEDFERLRSASSLSNYTIRPTDSFASLASFSEWNTAGHILQSDAVSLYSPVDLDLDFGSSAHELLANLRLTSPGINHRSDQVHIDHLNSVLGQTSQLSQEILRHCRARVEEATKELQELQMYSNKIDTLSEIVFRAVNHRLGGSNLHSIRSRKRDSEDSQATAVSGQSIDSEFNLTASESSVQFSIAKSDELNDNCVSVSTQTVLLDLLDVKWHSASDVRSASWPDWFDSFLVGADSPTHKQYLGNLLEIERELSQHQTSTAGTEMGTDTKLKHLLKKKKRVEDKIKELIFEQRTAKKDTTATGTAKLKAWIKRKITPERPARLEIVMNIDEDCAVGREVKQPEDATPLLAPSAIFNDDHDAFDTSIQGALKTSHTVLEAAQRDLLSIGQSLASAEQFLSSANDSISRAERVIKRAVKKREAMVVKLRLSAFSDESDDGLFLRSPGSPGLLGYSTRQVSLRSSAVSLASVYSTHSSCASVAATVTENDDEDTRVIRRLLLRKIEAGTCGAWDEMDKVLGWLRIVKEVVRGVKRRAYL